ncbi:acyl-CoA dehydrogenase family protein [Aquincola tertiaricarbonis]|uniref:acyl-CoA dehydrogenase family protein n=1 Tax=Aquincola tertiaricarbonis TaxID=391953 RepID=UPI000614F86A|nr:acyl-CoA dehydrogenase family protein [Aquincola tertiaricarbonis]
MHDEFEAAFDTLLAGVCTPDAVRRIDAGGPTDALWQALHDSGFADALVPEAQGGAGLALRDVGPLVQACGRHALPLPFAETMLVRALFAQAGRSAPDGPLSLDAAADLLAADERRLLQAAIHSALIAGAGAQVLAMAIAHAQQRVQFGKPIGTFQAVQHQLAVMAEQACSARMAAQMAFAAEGIRPDRTLAAMAMSVAGEAAAVLAASAHAVHGAIGVTAEFDLQLYTRRLLAWRTAAGSPGHWAQQVARHWQAAGGPPAVDFVLAITARAAVL